MSTESNCEEKFITRINTYSGWYKYIWFFLILFILGVSSTSIHMLYNKYVFYAVGEYARMRPCLGVCGRNSEESSVKTLRKGSKVFPLSWIHSFSYSIAYVYDAHFRVWKQSVWKEIFPEEFSGKYFMHFYNHNS